MKNLSERRPKLAKFRRLSRRKKGLLVRVFTVLAVYKVLLLLIPFNRFLSSPKAATNAPLADDSVADVAWAVRTVSGWMPTVFTCLVQALSVKRLLNRHPDVQLHVGVQKTTSEGFSAHAWVTYKDRIIVGERAGQVFEPLFAWK